LNHNPLQLNKLQRVFCFMYNGLVITSKDYDDRIISQGLSFQIDNYYEPKGVAEKRRINIVMEALNPKPGEIILDVGCGVGTFAFHSAKLGAKAFGIDYSPESIKAANALCVRFGITQNVSFVVGDAAQLPYKNEYFDKIVTADFIEHITLNEKEALVREMYRVLKPEGIAVVFTPNGIREKIGYYYWKARNLLFRDRIPTTELHYGLTHKSEFEKICRRHHFKLRLQYEDVTRPFLGKIPLLRNVLALDLLWKMKKK